MRDATIVVLKSNGRILDVRHTKYEDLAALALSVGCDESKADVLDLRGLTIIPGFIDTHVHCKYKDLWHSRRPYSPLVRADQRELLNHCI